MDSPHPDFPPLPPTSEDATRLLSEARWLEELPHQLALDGDTQGQILDTATRVREAAAIIRRFAA